MNFFKYTLFTLGLSNNILISVAVGALCFLIVFIFQAIALYVIATREGYKNKWMAFVPFFNTYYIGVCAQKNKFYNIDAKKIGIAATVVEAILFVLCIVYIIACVLVLKYEAYNEVETALGTVKEYYITGVPAELNWAAWMYEYMELYVLSTLNLILILLQVTLLICFFQTYACRRYVLFTITSVLFPIQGILFFVVRNNKGVNFKEYVMGEQARQYRMYQQYQQNVNQQNPYSGNPYQNPYNRNPYQSGNNTPDNSDPFDGLGGTNGKSGSDPFDDFDK